jgi:heptosyltransferase-1
MPRMHLLVVKTSSLGDVIHFLPAVSDLVRALPRATVDWVVEESFADIPKLHPGVSRVVPVALRRWRGAWWGLKAWREFGAFRRVLQESAYDGVLDAQGLLKSAALTKLARAPVWGQNRASAREGLAALFYDKTFSVARGQHAVARNRELAAKALGYALPTTPPDYGIAAPNEALPESIANPYVVLLHGTSRDSKCWPVGYWISLAQTLREKNIFALLPWGSDAERERAQVIAAATPGARVLPRLSLRRLAVVLGRAHAVVGVDTGLVHLGCALNRPTVAIFTDTAPALTGVYPSDASRAVNLGDRGVIPTPEQVVSAMQTLRVF